MTLGPSRRMRPRTLVALALLAGLCGWAAFGGLRELRDRTWPKRWGVVEPGAVYRSGQLHRALVHETLQQNRVQVIVDLTRENPRDADERAETEAIRTLGIALQRFPMHGNGTGSVEQVAGAVAAVEAARRQQKPVLVHCNSGAQRTSCVIAVHDLLVRGRSPRQVLDDMQRHGWDPDENGVLVEFLNANLPAIADQLVRMGVLPAVPGKIPRLPTPEV